MTDPKNLRRPRFWIWAYIFLRLITAILREFGLTLFKKNLKNEHVFLTGAGSGIGRLMAIKLGKIGAKLSLSDINLVGLEETRQILLNAGIPAKNIGIT